MSFLDRAFYSSGASFAFKPGASVAVARRGGTTASFDAMNKYFGICQMPVVGSTYWNQVHGAAPGEAEEEFILRKNDEGQWKILGWQAVKESSEDKGDAE